MLWSKQAADPGRNRQSPSFSFCQDLLRALNELHDNENGCVCRIYPQRKGVSDTQMHLAVVFSLALPFRARFPGAHPCQTVIALSATHTGYFFWQRTTPRLAPCKMACVRPTPRPFLSSDRPSLAKTDKIAWCEEKKEDAGAGRCKGIDGI